MRTQTWLGLLLCSCQSGVTLDVDGGLKFPCTPTSATERTSGGCPGQLFCGADHLCRSPTEPGTYACRGDFDCALPYRCGAAGRCVDPAPDALRHDAPDVALDAGRLIAGPTWGPLTALAVGRTFYQQAGAGPAVDTTPVAFSDGTDVYVAVVSQQGLLGPDAGRFFIAKTTLPVAVNDLAVARDWVFVLAGTSTWRFQWAPSAIGPVMPRLDAGQPLPRLLDSQLRVGNSAFPFVFEFSSTANSYLAFDALAQTASNVRTATGVISDIVDSDGRYAYAVIEGKLQATERATGPFLDFGTFELRSPGREVLITCGGGPVGRVPVFRSIHVGDNPDLTQVERPLIAARVDWLTDAGVATAQHWMRIDPEPSLGGPCASGVLRHVARGDCPVCGPDEGFVDMQWGVDEARGVPLLRSECNTGADAGSVFYDLETDSTGFACFMTRRIRAGYPGPGRVRATSHGSVAGVAFGKTALLRREGTDDWVPLTLNRTPNVVQAVPAGGPLIALHTRALYREVPQVGLALHQLVERSAPYPTWISGSYVLYDDGRVGPLSNLARGPNAAVLFATPARSDLTGPVHGTTTLTSTGRELLVMSAGDALLGADLTDAGRGPPRAVEVRAVPEPQVPIVSLAVLGAAAGTGALFHGFVLTSNRLFALEARTDEQWALTALDAAPGERLEVWADGDRGRLGYADGRVYSLPSTVKLAPELDAGVSDYQQYCGRAYALTAHGLYRLEANPDGGVGSWSLQPSLRAGPHWERLYGAANDELWVLARDGTAAQLRGAPCTR